MQDYGHEIAEYLYYTPDALDKAGQIWPVRAGRTMAKPGYSAGPKRIESYSLHFVREGSVELEYKGKQVTLNAGDLFCLFPMHTYTYREAERKPANPNPHQQQLEMTWLVIDGPGAERLLSLAGLRLETPFIRAAGNPRVYRTLTAILSLMRASPASRLIRSLDMQSRLYQLFAFLAKETPDDEASAASDWFSRSLDYIELHAAEGISVRQAAEAAGVNRTYYSAVFLEKTGMTPSLYMSKLRMDKAKQLLADTQASITEIAYTLGYSSLYAFTRTFKHRYSITPTAYRNRSGGGSRQLPQADRHRRGH